MNATQAKQIALINQLSKPHIMQAIEAVIGLGGLNTTLLMEESDAEILMQLGYAVSFKVNVAKGRVFSVDWSNPK